MSGDSINQHLSSLIVNKSPCYEVGNPTETSPLVPLPLPFYFSIIGNKLNQKCDFFIYNGHLVLQQDGRVVMQVNINMFYFQESSTTLQGSEKDRKPEIVIFNASQVIKVVFSSLQDLEAWRKEITIFCVQRNIFEVYKAEEIISEGPRSRVFIASMKSEKVKNGKQETKIIKSFTKTSLSSSPQALDMFLNELTVLQQLSESPHFSKLEEIYESGSSFFLVLEYIEGDLLEDIASPSFISDVQRLEIVSQLAKALKQLKEKRIIHRDFKPENIIFQPNGVVKVIDFGLSQRLIEDQDTTSLMKEYSKAGTPGYIAPEILRCTTPKSQISFSNDVYSLGIVYYQLVTGSNPFFDSEDTNSSLEKNSLSDFTNSDSYNSGNPKNYPKQQESEEDSGYNVNKILEKNRDSKIDFQSIQFLASREELMLMKSMLAEEPTHRPPIELICQKLKKMKIKEEPIFMPKSEEKTLEGSPVKFQSSPLLAKCIGGGRRRRGTESGTRKLSRSTDLNYTTSPNKRLNLQFREAKELFSSSHHGSQL